MPLAQIVLGLLAGASLLPFTGRPLSPAVGRFLMLVSSLLFGAVLAVLFFADRGWVAVVCALPGIVAFYYRTSRRRPSRPLLDVNVSPVRRAEAEALMERARRGEDLYAPRRGDRDDRGGAEAGPRSQRS